MGRPGAPGVRTATHTKSALTGRPFSRHPVVSKRGSQADLARTTNHPDPQSVAVRLARESDLEQINEIYNHYILKTAITFDIEPWTMGERRAWFAKFGTHGRYRLVVAEDRRGVIGFAGTSRFREKAAYDPTVEMTIYCASEATGHGVGSMMYEALFPLIADEDIRSGIAAITLPNEVSIRLHERFGFTLVGVTHDVGRKFGKFWDVAWYERIFGPAG